MLKFHIDILSKYKTIPTSDGVYIYSRSASNILIELGHTDKEWYDKFIREDKIHPKCPICGTPLKFINISRGYSFECDRSHITEISHRDLQYHSNIVSALNSVEAKAKSSYTRFLSLGNCNDQCLFYLILTSTGLIKFGITFMTIEDRLHRDLQYHSNIVSALNSVEAKAKSSYTRFLSLGNCNDQCLFYLILTSTGLIKFGITFMTIEDRLHWYDFDILSYHVILYDTRLRVAELEKFIKIKLNITSEYIDFSILHNLIKLIREWKMLP